MTGPRSLRLVFDDATVATIALLMEKAAGRRVPLARMREYASGVRPVPTDWNRDMTIRVGDVQVTYTHEEHATGDGQPLPMRHLSVSMQAPGSRPPALAVRMLMGVFGFDVSLPFSVWPETLADKRVAVNLVQPIGAEGRT